MCPNSLNGQDSGLGWQLIYNVGYGFPTMGNSQPNLDYVLLFLSRTIFPLPLSYFPFTSVLSLLLLLSLLLRKTHPFSILPSLIYSLRWWGTHDYLLVSLVWLGPNLIALDKEYASLETVAMALELVPVSKRLLGNDIPQGNIELSRSRATFGKYNPQPIHTWSAWACLTCDQWNEHFIGLGLKNVLGVCSGQGPRPSGPEAICHT